ncbi:POK25 protein, partial [Pygoscelis papua]
EHNAVHWGTENLLRYLQKSVISRNMVEIIKSVTQRCEICCRNNPKTQNKIQFGKTTEGQAPGEYWQIDFTELPRKGGLKYLLVLVDTYTGWPEAFPCRTNKAKDVVKILLKEIIPRFGVPLGMSSDRGPHFIAKVITEISRLLDINWNLHTPYRPQSSGKVERMNYTLKTQLSKICQETSMNWTQALPLALLRIRVQPRGRQHLSLYELMYGRPYQIPGLPGEMQIQGESDARNYLIALGKVLRELNRYVILNKSIGLDSPAHPFQPGDWVYIKSWTSEPLQEKMERTISN